MAGEISRLYIGYWTFWCDLDIGHCYSKWHRILMHTARFDGLIVKGKMWSGLSSLSLTILMRQYLIYKCPANECRNKVQNYHLYCVVCRYMLSFWTEIYLTKEQILSLIANMRKFSFPYIFCCN